MLIVHAPGSDAEKVNGAPRDACLTPALGPKAEDTIPSIGGMIVSVEQGAPCKTDATRRSRTQRLPKGVHAYLAGVLLLPLLLVAGAHRDSFAGTGGTKTIGVSRSFASGAARRRDRTRADHVLDPSCRLVSAPLSWGPSVGLETRPVPLQVGSAPKGTTNRWIVQPNVQLRRTAPATPISPDRDGQKPASVSAPLDVPLGTVTLLTQGFEAAFPSAPWSVTGDPTWDESNYRHYTGSRSAYCVDGGASRVSPPGPYPNNCDSWMEAGPFDLSDATSANLAFHAYVRTEPSYDFFAYGASHDGSNYAANTVSGDMGTSWLACPGGRLPKFDLSGFLGDSSVWIAFVFSSDSGTTYEGVYVDDILLTKYVGTPPTLTWAGTPGYETDGVAPDAGDPSSTTFTFRAKYTDVSGGAPLRARALIQRRDCGDGWRACRSLALTKESGDIATGAIYSCTTTLVNLVYKYRFRFKDSTGDEVPGDPTAFHQGPLMVGRPWVCWTGAPGFEADGLYPESGPLGTNFKFQVKYADSAGDAPTTCDLVLRRNGRIYRQKAMAAAPAGYLRLGKIYRTSVTVDKPGVYEYRFHFADASGNALGPPNNWTAGPTLTGTSSVAVTSLAAVPTAGGAQLTFSLSGAAKVTATVVNVAGRPIRTVVADKPLDAGLQTLLWNRQADTGLAVPPGLYLIRLTACADDGSQSAALATLSVR
jgi:hypothetical protein